MDRAATGETGGTKAEDAVLEIFELGFPWPTVDPFIVAVHHRDQFPPGTEEMGPATTHGLRHPGSGPSAPGWGMYYGSVVPGFPVHPHRGFETVTVVRTGTVDHSDSLGATARYGAGDVQWLTAGRGIQHAEMFPLLDRQAANPAELFQIWLNLPASDKMVGPSFTMFWNEDVPRTVRKDDVGRSTEITVVAGAFEDVSPLPPPPNSWASAGDAELAIWQIASDPSAEWTLPPTHATETVRALYVVDGSVEIGGRQLEAPAGAVLRTEAQLRVTSGGDGAQALVLQSRPIGEPVAAGGPFVMNTAAELEAANRDYRRTGFGGWPWPVDDPVHPRSAPRFARHPDGPTEYPEAD